MDKELKAYPLYHKHYGLIYVKRNIQVDDELYFVVEREPDIILVRVDECCHLTPISQFAINWEE